MSNARIDPTTLSSGGETCRLPLSEEAKAMNRVADAINRLADVYLYVNDPEGEEGPAPTNLPEGFRGMR